MESRAAHAVGWFSQVMGLNNDGIEPGPPMRWLDTIRPTVQTAFVIDGVNMHGLGHTMIVRNADTFTFAGHQHPLNLLWCHASTPH
jgi:hypothetical protein